MTIYRFGKENTATGAAFNKDVLGGKGFGLAEMSKLGLPVPPGFTIPCGDSVAYNAETTHYGRDKHMLAVMDEVLPHLDYLVDCFGYMPLVSVRSGARKSMPGMMDTILNVGLTQQNLPAWADRIGVRAAQDSYRRLIQMYGSVVKGIDHAKFEAILAHIRAEAKVATDAELDDQWLACVVDDYIDLYHAETGEHFPGTLEAQLRGAIEAVFKSWNNPRAIEYRKIHGYSDDWGTAVNVQAMVFGNMNDASCTGVIFSRDTDTGEQKIMGEFLINAQGEDVVAGIRTPEPVGKMADWNPQAFGELLKHLVAMEQHFNDIQDMEFTVQDGKLFVLQTRDAKRTAQAAVKAAWDFYDAGRITASQMFGRITAAQITVLLRPQIDPAFKVAPHLKGIAAGGGVVSGKIVFADHDPAAIDEPVVLVAKETTPDDIALMNKAVGILTATGGATSHAAVVARGLDKACVVGATDLTVDALVPGTQVTIDGATGHVWFGIDVPIIPPQPNAYLAKMEQVAMELAGYIPRCTPTAEAAYEDLLAFTTSAPQVQIDAAFVHDAPATVLDAILNGSAQVILDLRRAEDYFAADDVLFNAFGAAKAGTYTTLIKRLLETGVLQDKVVLINVSDHADKLAAAGYKIGGKMAETVTDLINGEWVSIDLPTIHKLFGGQEGYGQFLKILEAAGKELKAQPSAKYPRRALLNNLGS